MFKNWFIALVFMMLICLGRLWADDVTVKPAPSPTLTASGLDLEKKQLEVERLQLENEKLKLEMEKMKFQSTQTPGTGNSNENHDSGSQKAEKEAAYLADESKKAQDLALQKKDDADLLIVDFGNAEVWYKGVRYALHELYTLAIDQKWPMSKRVEERNSSGIARNLFQIKNLSLLRYEDNKRGIIKMDSPQKEGDLKIMTPEGITFDSSAGDVRNAFHNLYFKYDGQDSRNDLKVIRYSHGRGLDFSDNLEVLIDKDGKIKTLRYGVLDEK